jgi:hypothetical protein
MAESANYCQDNSYLGMYNEGWLTVFQRFLEYLDVLECPEFLVNPEVPGCLVDPEDLEDPVFLVDPGDPVFPVDPEVPGCLVDPEVLADPEFLVNPGDPVFPVDPECPGVLEHLEY